MPVSRDPAAPPDLLRTILSGEVTDQELLGYYTTLDFATVPHPWRELVDGTTITEMGVTPAGQWRLAEYFSRHVEQVRGGRVAMVATHSAAYGMFRMWEMQREDLDYEVRVFRNLADAGLWLASG